MRSVQRLKEDSGALVQKLRDSIGGGGGSINGTPSNKGINNSKSIPDYSKRAVNLRKWNNSDGYDPFDDSLTFGSKKLKIQTDTDGGDGNDEGNNTSYKTTQIIDVDQFSPSNPINLLHEPNQGKWNIGGYQNHQTRRFIQDDILEDLDSQVPKSRPLSNPESYGKIQLGSQNELIAGTILSSSDLELNRNAATPSSIYGSSNLLSKTNSVATLLSTDSICHQNIPNSNYENNLINSTFHSGKQESTMNGNILHLSGGNASSPDKLLNAGRTMKSFPLNVSSPSMEQGSFDEENQHLWQNDRNEDSCNLSNVPFRWILLGFTCGIVLSILLCVLKQQFFDVESRCIEQFDPIVQACFTERNSSANENGSQEKKKSCNEELLACKNEIKRFDTKQNIDCTRTSVSEPVSATTQAELLSTSSTDKFVDYDENKYPANELDEKSQTRSSDTNTHFSSSTNSVEATTEFSVENTSMKGDGGNDPVTSAAESNLNLHTTSAFSTETAYSTTVLDSTVLNEGSGYAASEASNSFQPPTETENSRHFSTESRSSDYVSTPINYENITEAIGTENEVSDSSVGAYLSNVSARTSSASSEETLPNLVTTVSSSDSSAQTLAEIQLTSESPNMANSEFVNTGNEKDKVNVTIPTLETKDSSEETDPSKETEENVNDNVKFDSKNNPTFDSDENDKKLQSKGLDPKSFVDTYEPNTVQKIPKKQGNTVSAPRNVTRRRRRKGWFERFVEVVKEVINTVTPFQID